MTVVDLLRTLRRRWTILVAGVVLGALVVLVFDRPAPLYTAQTEVLFVAPEYTATSPSDDKYVPPLVAFAASVERVVNGGPDLRLVSSDAPLYGTGERAVTSVQLVNQGTQWTSSFSRPVLAVETIDATEAGARQRVVDAVAQIRAVTAQLQDGQGVPEAQRITAVPVAVNPPVVYVGTTRTGQVKGLAGLGLATLLASCAACVAVDRRLRRRGPAGAATPFRRGRTGHVPTSPPPDRSSPDELATPSLSGRR